MTKREKGTRLQDKSKKEAINKNPPTSSEDQMRLDEQHTVNCGPPLGKSKFCRFEDEKQKTNRLFSANSYVRMYGTYKRSRSKKTLYTVF